MKSSLTAAILAALTVSGAQLHAQCPPYSPPAPPEGRRPAVSPPVVPTPAPPRPSPQPPSTGNPGPTAPGPSAAGPRRPVTGGRPSAAPSGGAAPTGSPAGSSAGSPSGPRTGGPRAPSQPARPAAAPARTGPRGTPIGEDLCSWKLWWQFNHDAHLQMQPGIKAATATTGSDEFYLGATRGKMAKAVRLPKQTLLDQVLPALRRSAAAGPNDVVAASLLAIARVGVDHPDFTRVDVILPKLADRDQAVRETAALALGLTGDAQAMQHLVGLVLDDAAGRRLVSTHVDQRTRSFAAYGIGLLARAVPAMHVQRQAFAACDTVLSQTSGSQRELRVAAAQALGLMAVNVRRYDGAKLHDQMVVRLGELVGAAESAARGGVSQHEVAAHGVTAIARLLGREHFASSRHCERFAALLAGRSPETGRRLRVPHVLAQSCALALGQMAGPDRKSVRECLVATWLGHKDAQTRSFALLALGRIGGSANRAWLLKAFRKASANIERPWCALALGLLAEQRRQATGAKDPLVIEALEKQFARTKNPEAAAAFAVALGLADADAAAKRLSVRLAKSSAKPLLATSICDALTMIAKPAGQDALRTMLERADRRPVLLERASVALARLGDRTVAGLLAARLADGEGSYAMQRALANALADIGDQRQLEPLLALLGDASRSAIARASAARAIGGIVERGRPRWNTALRQGTNYRANVATLTDRSAGVMDLR